MVHKWVTGLVYNLNRKNVYVRFFPLRNQGNPEIKKKCQKFNSLFFVGYEKKILKSTRENS